MAYDFQRYLAAKQQVDQQALNTGVWDSLVKLALAEKPLRVLDAGCGTGAMAALLFSRLLDRGDTYLGVDSDQENIAAAQTASWPGSPEFVCADFFDIEPNGSYDLVVASSFLDLVDLPAALGRIFGFLRPGGLAYLTFNFDGVTIFEPPHPLDDPIIRAYHDSMDLRPGGGGSRTGRKLFSALPAAGFNLLTAGSSDWIAHHKANDPNQGDTAYFLAHILHFFETSCAGTPGLEEWLAARRSQIAAQTLYFIAHQYDFLAQRPVE